MDKIMVNLFTLESALQLFILCPFEPLKLSQLSTIWIINFDIAIWLNFTNFSPNSQIIQVPVSLKITPFST